MKKINRIRLYSLTIISLFIMLTNSCKNDDNNNIPSTVKDIDGNIYHTVTIGTQVWMVENLKVTHYRNGDSIPNIIDSSTWSNLTTGAYCYYDNKATTGIIYGKLYNWYAINDNRNIAPVGWHIPTYSEWKLLSDFLGDTVFNAGGKLKEADTIHWKRPNTGATNESGFTALPGGFRYFNGPFTGFSKYGYWWTSTESYPGGKCWYWAMSYDGTGVNFSNAIKTTGFSVRCIKDN